MGQKIEREWKSIVCPDWKEKTAVMREWNILSEKGNGLQRTLTLIDCHNPRLSEFGGADCNWACERAIAKAGTIRSEVGQLLVSIILAAGILWIGFYNIYISPHLHLYGLFLFFGIPFVIGLMLYYGWKMMRYIRGSSKKIFSKHKRISEKGSFTAHGTELAMCKVSGV